MSTDYSSVAIRIIQANETLRTIKILRESTGLSLSAIQEAIRSRLPIPVTGLYSVDHEENEAAAIELFAALTSANVEYEIILDGETETREHFDNAMEQWREIGIRTEMLSDLKSGQPCIATLEWVQVHYGEDTFQTTIRQIVNRDGYTVDTDTYQWAEQQLQKLSD